MNEFFIRTIDKVNAICGRLKISPLKWDDVCVAIIYNRIITQHGVVSIENDFFNRKFLTLEQTKSIEQIWMQRMKRVRSNAMSKFVLWKQFSRDYIWCHDSRLLNISVSDKLIKHKFRVGWFCRRQIFFVVNSTGCQMHFRFYHLSKILFYSS